MSATARMAIENEPALEHLKQVMQMLAAEYGGIAADLSYDEGTRFALRAIEQRVRLAIADIEATESAVLKATQELSNARDEEVLSLMQDLRETRDQLARFEYVRPQILIPWEDEGVVGPEPEEGYVVYTLHRRVEGKFTRDEWYKAVALRDQLRIAAAMKSAPTEPTRPHLVPRGD